MSLPEPLQHQLPCIVLGIADITSEAAGHTGTMSELYLAVHECKNGEPLM